MASATTADVAVPLLRPLTAEEAVYADRLLEWAETLISARFPDLDGLETEAVVMVESMAVARVLRNPDGKYQEAVGSGEYSSTRDRVGADGILRITDEEWQLLQPSGYDSGAFSIDTVGFASVHLPICSLYFGALYCSCGADLTNYQYPIFESPESF